MVCRSMPRDLPGFMGRGLRVHSVVQQPNRFRLPGALGRDRSSDLSAARSTETSAAQSGAEAPIDPELEQIAARLERGASLRLELRGR